VTALTVAAPTFERRVLTDGEVVGDETTTYVLMVTTRAYLGW
jgi:hypothetical protein